MLFDGRTRKSLPTLSVGELLEMERIKVLAAFDNQIVPIKFQWGNRIYPIKGVTYRWITR